jgi:hypothetical protein
MIARIASQNVSATGTSTTPTATYPAVPTQNNLLVSFIRTGSLVAATTLPSGWSVGLSLDRGATFSCHIAYKIAGAAETQTVAWGTGSALFHMHAYEFNGNLTASPLDATASGTTASATTLTSGTLTPTLANDFCVAFVGLGGSSGGFNSDWRTTQFFSSLIETAQSNGAEKQLVAVQRASQFKRVG